MKCSVAKGKDWAALSADTGIEIEMPKSRTSPQLSSLPITEFEPPGCQIRARGGSISWQRKRVCWCPTTTSVIGLSLSWIGSSSGRMSDEGGQAGRGRVGV